MKPELPPVPEGCPPYSVWSISAQHHETKERKTGWVRFTGPMPLKDEIDYFIPPSMWAIYEMKFLWNVWKDDE